MTRRLNFPKLVLTRLPTPEQVVRPDNVQYQNKENEDYLQQLEELRADLPNKILKYYNKADRAYAIKRYTSWNELQHNLAILLIKPQAIERIDAEYQRLIASDLVNTKLVTLEPDDLTHDYSQRYLHINMMVINTLPRAIRLAIWKILQPNFVDDNWNEYVVYLYQGLYDLLMDYPKEGFCIAINLLSLLYKHRANYLCNLTIYQYLDSLICVPYIIANMNAKTRRDDAQKFLDNFPETFYNELVYILFTDPTDDWYKEAYKNAKKLLRYMVDELPFTPNYIAQLYAAIARHEASINSTALSDFLKQYIDNHQRINQQKKAKIADEKSLSMVAPDKIDTNTNGIPAALLNSAWQQQTRKRSFALNETIYIEENAKKNIESQLPILEALLPPIIANTNKPLPIDAFEQLLLMLKLSTEDKPIPALAEVLPAFTKESLAHLSDELWNDYIDNRVAGGYSAYFPEEDDLRIHGIFNKEKKWFMTASVWLADERLADKIWPFMKKFESHSYVRSSILHSFKVLAALASNYPDSKRGDAAVKMLIKLASKSRSTLRPHATQALETYGKNLGLSMEALADRLLPDFELTQNGTKVIDYHPNDQNSRKLTISVTPDLKFTYQDETGKSYKNPPKARQIDDDEVVKKILDQHKLDKKELRGIATDLPKALEKMMVSQRSISISDFLNYYVKHPVAQVLVKRLVWQVQTVDIDKTIKTDKQTFRVSESLELLDSEDNTLADKWLAEDTQVSLPHPILLLDEKIEQWSEVFADYELIQPFEQLSRPLYYLTDTEKTTNKIQRFDEVHFARGSLMGLTSPAKGWEGFSFGRGNYNGFSKNINDHQVDITLYDGFPMWDKAPDDDKGHKIETIELSNNMDEISASEYLLAIEEMARVS